MYQKSRKLKKLEKKLKLQIKPKRKKHIDQKLSGQKTDAQWKILKTEFLKE